MTSHHDKRGRALEREGRFLVTLRQEAGELIARRLEIEGQLRPTPLWRLEASLDVLEEGSQARRDLAWVIERRKQAVRRRCALLLARADLFEGASLPFAGAATILGHLAAPFIGNASFVSLFAALVGGFGWIALRWIAYSLKTEAKAMAAAIGDK